jgi:hypothetical protein
MCCFELLASKTKQASIQMPSFRHLVEQGNLILFFLSSYFFFNNSHPNGCKVVCACGFDLYCPNVPHVYWPFINVLWKNVYANLIFELDCLFLVEL